VRLRKRKGKSEGVLNTVQGRHFVGTEPGRKNSKGEREFENDQGSAGQCTGTCKLQHQDEVGMGLYCNSR
jgi:hypothetical protein